MSKFMLNFRIYQVQMELERCTNPDHRKALYEFLDELVLELIDLEKMSDDREAA